MPYISPNRREAFNDFLQKTKDLRIDAVGELTYLFTMLAKIYMTQHGLSYKILNDIHGAFSCADKEFYRKVTAPYESLKCKENGEIF